MAVDFLSSLNKNGSGMNLRELATSLVQAEILPKQDRANAKIEEAEVAVSALGQLASQMSALRSSISIAREQSALSAKSSQSALDIEITNAGLAQPTTASIEVQQLAQPQVLEFTGFSSSDATFDEGTLEIDFGSYDTASPPVFTKDNEKTGYTVTVEDGTTLADLATRLNSVEGVNARVIRKGDGTYSLGITTEPGTQSSLQITGTTTGTSGNDFDMSALDTTADITTVEIKSAQNAQITLDGISVERPSNEIDDLIDGTTLTLNETTTSPAKLSISSNENDAFAVMEALVYQINVVGQYMVETTRKGETADTSGSLAANTGAQNMKRQFFDLISDGFEGYSDRAMYLSDFGVKTERDGTLTLDRKIFMDTLKQDPTAFDAILNDGMRADEEGFTFEDVPALSNAQKVTFARDPATGTATLDGKTLTELSTQNGSTTYEVTEGALKGMDITVKDGVNSSTLRYGKSFTSALESKLNDMLSSSGVVRRQITTLNENISTQKTVLTDLDDRNAMLEARYMAQFGAMEVAVSQLNSTGEYLSNLVAAWNKD